MKPNEVSPSSIKAERLQTRAATNSDYIDELAERMKEGDVFPPITIFSDGKEEWLADGIHRLDAAIKAKKKIGVDRRRGTRKEALEFAFGANRAHGLRLTTADKRRRAMIALREWPERSSRSIAELCGVSHTFIDEKRQSIQLAEFASSNSRPVPTKRVGLDGKTRRQPRSSKATDFDPKALDAQPAKETKQPRSGKAMVSTKDRKEFYTLHAKLCRVMQQLDIYSEFIESLSQMMERAKQL